MTTAKHLLQQQLTHHQNHTNTRINQLSAEHDKAVTILKQQFDTQDIARASSLRTTQDELVDTRRQIARLEAEVAKVLAQVPSQTDTPVHPHHSCTDNPPQPLVHSAVPEQRRSTRDNRGEHRCDPHTVQYNWLTVNTVLTGCIGTSHGDNAETEAYNMHH